jgi:excisionase family DNA binding protein
MPDGESVYDFWITAMSPQGSRRKDKISPTVPQISKRMLTVKEVSDYLNVGRATIYRMIKRKQFPAFRLTGGAAGDWRINIEDLEHWLRKKSASDN